MSGFHLPTSLWDMVWRTFCHGASILEEERHRRCEERWGLKDRTVWIVRRKDPGVQKLAVFSDPGQAQAHVWDLAKKGIEAYPPQREVVRWESPECQ